MDTKKYYLINLNTRRSSVATHLRRDNFTLDPGCCIYLGELTSELVLKYIKYGFLNIQLRILTKDIATKILEKSVNCTKEIVDDVLYTFDSKQKSKTDVPLVEKEENIYEEQNSYVEVSSSQIKKETPAIVESHNRDQELTNELLGNREVNQPSKVECQYKDIQNTIEASNDNKESSIENRLQSEEEEFKSVDELIENTTIINNVEPQEIDVVSENKKEDLRSMDYDALYDLAKANGFKSKGRPSREKLVSFLSN